jgi:mRNA interferase HicA
MKKTDFTKYLLKKGCTLKREGGKHEIWENSIYKTWSTVPRHKEIKRNLCVKICNDLDISAPF